MCWLAYTTISFSGTSLLLCWWVRCLWPVFRLSCLLLGEQALLSSVQVVHKATTGTSKKTLLCTSYYPLSRLLLSQNRDGQVQSSRGKRVSFQQLQASGYWDDMQELSISQLASWTYAVWISQRQTQSGSRTKDEWLGGVQDKDKRNGRRLSLQRGSERSGAVEVAYGSRKRILWYCHVRGGERRYDMVRPSYMTCIAFLMVVLV